MSRVSQSRHILGGKRKIKSRRGKAKVKRVMHEWGKRKLHSGSKRGPVVTSQKQAVAIAISEAKKTQ